MEKHLQKLFQVQLHYLACCSTKKVNRLFPDTFFWISGVNSVTKSTFLQTLQYYAPWIRVPKFLQIFFICFLFPWKKWDRKYVNAKMMLTGLKTVEELVTAVKIHTKKYMNITKDHSSLHDESRTVITFSSSTKCCVIFFMTYDIKSILFHHHDTQYAKRNSLPDFLIV